MLEQLTHNVHLAFDYLRITENPCVIARVN